MRWIFRKLGFVKISSHTAQKVLFEQTDTNKGGLAIVLIVVIERNDSLGNDKDAAGDFLGSNPGKPYLTLRHVRVGRHT
jgi:hypothetical protein